MTVPEDPCPDLVDGGLVAPLVVGLPTDDLLTVQPVELPADAPSVSGELSALRDDER